MKKLRLGDGINQVIGSLMLELGLDLEIYQLLSDPLCSSSKAVMERRGGGEGWGTGGQSLVFSLRSF